MTKAKYEKLISSTEEFKCKNCGKKIKITAGTSVSIRIPLRKINK